MPVFLMSVRWLKGKMLLFGLVVGYQGLMLIVYMLRYFLLHEGLWLSKKKYSCFYLENIAILNALAFTRQNDSFIL